MEAQVYQRMAELDAEHWWFVARREILEALIRREIRPPANARILEVGCGTGHNLKMLDKFGRLEATELDAAARTIAAERFGRAVQNVALPDLSMFEPASFDLVAVLDVLEHVADDQGALAAIRSRVKPGGKVLITVPANPWMWTAHDVAHHHHRRYRKRQLAELAGRASLEIDLLSPFNSLLFPPIAAARLIGKARGRETSDDAMPSRPVNTILRTVFSLERGLIGRVPMPFGVSLVAILRRPD